MHSKGIIPLCALFAAILLVTITPAMVKAHAPESVILFYNSASQTLTVTVAHETSSPNTHYIKKIDIKKNGKPLESFSYDNQSDPSEISYSYKIPAKIGDKLEAFVSCSAHGSKSETLIIKKQLT